MVRNRKTFSTIFNAAIFIVLEVAALGMLRSNGILQDSWVMKGAHAFYAYVWGKTESIKYYFSLQKENARLAEENFNLACKLRDCGNGIAECNALQSGAAHEADSASVAEDSTGRYIYRQAEIVKISNNRQHNYIIVDKGSEDGVTPQSGIITGQGVIGIIDAVSRHYSYGISFKNTGMTVSARIGKTGPVGSLVWDGANTDGALLNEGALSHRHVVNLSGGGRTARVYATFVASDQKGIALGDNRKDYSGRINGSFNLLDDLLEINIHTEYREAHRDQRASNSNFGAAMKMNPTEPIYDEDNPSGYNVIIGGDIYFNPLADVMLKQRDKIDKWMLADANVKLNLPLGFSAQATVSWQDRQMQATYYTSSQHRNSIQNGRNGEGYHEFSKTINVSIEPTINFDRVFANDHAVNAVLGYSFYEENSENFHMTNYNFPVDGTGAWDMGAGDWLKDGRALMDSYKYPRTRLIAFFGRVNYSYRSRYMITASLRHEGSSKFGKDHRWGNFWAVSGGWRISSEPWMDGIGWLDDLKIRAGYGVTGNCGFGAGQTAFRYASGSYWPMDGDWIMSYGPGNNVNNDLHWEEKSELNIGVDYALLGNRLYGKFDWYHRWVDGMIYDITVTTPPAMYDSTVMNYGNLENWGWEFEIGGIPVQKKDFEWTSSMRLSANKSKITSLWGNHSYQDRVNFPAPGAPGTGGRLEEGTMIGSYYLLEYAGLNEEGKWLIYDKNNNVILGDNRTIDDKRYLGNAIPKLIVSWDNMFRYKNLSLGINLRSWLDFDVFNAIDMYYGLANVSNQNVLRSAFLKNRDIKQEKLLCDYWLEDGSFLKIDAISLGYTLNMKKWQKYIDAIDLYLTVRNVACLTGYSGLNPEVNINGLDPGYEWFDLYPETRRYTFGVKLTF